MKASSNLALLTSGWRGGRGFDIVSGGELGRVLAAEETPGKVVFSGVAKTEDEMERALRAGILMFNVESAEELEALDRVGRRLGRRAPFALRVNPEVDAKTHRYIATGLEDSKFGVPFDEAVALYRKSRRMRGVVGGRARLHIGSQLTKRRRCGRGEEGGGALPGRSLDRGLAAQVPGRRRRAGHPLPGGEAAPSVEEYAAAICEAVQGLGATVVLEPGRVLVGNAGVLLTRVLYRKQDEAKQFRDRRRGHERPPAAGAVRGAPRDLAGGRRKERRALVDVVGPVCESSDVLAKARRLAGAASKAS